MRDLSAIINYIQYLKCKCGLFVSLHPDPQKDTLIFSGELRMFNFHENPYCAYIKSNPSAGKHCIECQKKVMQRCKSGVFSGVCFAGVRERVYPIVGKEEVTGFISVSGYAAEHARSYLNRVSDRYGFPPEELSKAYRMLDSRIPDETLLDTLLMPLCSMLELAYCQQDTACTEETFAEQVVRFIKKNHNQDITSEDICRHFYCSRSYMSTQFNRATGKSIREYINQLRIADAKSLLQTSTLSVTEIAFTVGFCDSNYFSAVFKKQVGMSPMKYRKAFRQADRKTAGDL